MEPLVGILLQVELVVQLLEVLELLPQAVLLLSGPELVLGPERVLVPVPEPLVVVPLVGLVELQVGLQVSAMPCSVLL